MSSKPAQRATDATTTAEAANSRRQHPRTSAPCIKIRCEGELYVPENWSLGGCFISGYEGRLRPGTAVLLELFLNVAHEHDGLPVRAEVVRFEAERKGLALRFDTLNAKDLLEFCDIVGEKPSDEVLSVID